VDDITSIVEIGKKRCTKSSGRIVRMTRIMTTPDFAGAVFIWANRRQRSLFNWPAVHRGSPEGTTCSLTPASAR